MSEQPNILFIMADQFRYDYLGSAGADYVRTPNLDRIARSGVLFEQCYTNCPICAPARIGLAAGQEPARLGSLDNQSYLPASARTYYQRLRDAGYRVGCSGKLDLAKPDGYNSRGDRPCCYTWGFTHPIEIEGKMHAGQSSTPRGPYGRWLAEQGLYSAFHADYVRRRATGWVKEAAHDSVLPDHAFADTYIGQRSVTWLREIPSDFAWHMFVSFAGPHDPFDPPSGCAELFREATMPAAIVDELANKPAWHAARDRGLSADEIMQTRRQYCASIKAIDDQVGEMLQVLEERNELDNTYIIFSSDHGEMLGDHGMYTKSVAYEGSIHVPLIVAGPGISGGRSSTALIELIDINPTICELAGLPAQENIDARSFAAILRSETAVHRTETISQMRNWRLVRTERYKYVENHNDIDELYDLQQDPNELVNLIDRQPDLARDLHRRLLVRTMEGQWRR